MASDAAYDKRFSLAVIAYDSDSEASENRAIMFCYTMQLLNATYLATLDSKHVMLTRNQQSAKLVDVVFDQYVNFFFLTCFKSSVARQVAGEIASCNRAFTAEVSQSKSTRGKHNSLLVLVVSSGNLDS